MNRKSRLFIRLAAAVLVTAGAFNVWSDQHWYGGADDVEFAADLWDAMLQAGLVGSQATNGHPYVGTHPHGAILESAIHTITVKGVTNTLAAKLSYRGIGVSIEEVVADRAGFIEDVTVMFKREDGYDTANQNWFWAKYNPDGSLDKTPNGIQLAGRIAKGKAKGCIACHLKAEGGDLLFIN